MNAFAIFLAGFASGFILAISVVLLIMWALLSPEAYRVDRN
jgi:hypothetical protein